MQTLSNYLTHHDYFFHLPLNAFGNKAHFGSKQNVLQRMVVLGLMFKILYSYLEKELGLEGCFICFLSLDKPCPRPILYQGRLEKEEKNNYGGDLKYFAPFQK